MNLTLSMTCSHTKRNHVEISKIWHKIGKEVDIFTLTLMWPSASCVTLTSLMTCNRIQMIHMLKQVKCIFSQYDLDSMTLILKHDLDMVRMYLHTKNEVSMSSGSKVIVWTDGQTDRHNRKHYLPAYAVGNKTWLWFDRRVHIEKLQTLKSFSNVLVALSQFHS